MEEGIKKKVKTNEEGEQELLFESLLSPQYLKEGFFINLIGLES